MTSIGNDSNLIGSTSTTSSPFLTTSSPATQSAIGTPEVRPLSTILSLDSYRSPPQHYHHLSTHHIPHHRSSHHMVTASPKQETKSLPPIHLPSSVLTLASHPSSGSHIIGGRIKLDVGGVHYSTSSTTLCSLENDSALARMFTPPFSIAPQDDGTYFIDRDGTLFGYILNWLRDGRLPTSLIHNRHLLDDVMNEGKYFGLTKMEAAIIHANTALAAAAECESKRLQQQQSSRRMGQIRGMSMDEAAMVLTAKQLLCGEGVAPPTSTLRTIITVDHINQFISGLVRELIQSPATAGGIAIVRRNRKDDLDRWIAHRWLTAIPTHNNNGGPIPAKVAAAVPAVPAKAPAPVPAKTAAVAPAATTVTAPPMPSLHQQRDDALKCIFRYEYDMIIDIETNTHSYQYDQLTMILIMTFIWHTHASSQ